MIKKIFPKILSILMFMSVLAPASASVTITGTRVIYPESEKEVTIRLNNQGDNPALVQAWVDNGDANEPLEKIKVPFILTPPVFRMEPHKGQTLRLIFTNGSLPKDKESIFWLNVLDIPPKNKNMEDKNNLQMAIRSRIKIFYRPDGLDMEGADNAAKNIIWSRDAKAGKITAYNKSKYYVNISSVSIDGDGKKYTSTRGDIVVPGGTTSFDVPGVKVVDLNKNNINYNYIDDYGSARNVEGILNAK